MEGRAVAVRATCPECGRNILVRDGVIGLHMSEAQNAAGIPLQCLGTGTEVLVDPLQVAADLAPMLTYAASLAVEGKPAVAYFAMLASIRGELNRLFTQHDLKLDVHNPLPKESS